MRRLLATFTSSTLLLLVLAPAALACERRPRLLRRDERQGRDQRRLHPDRVLRDLRVRDEHAPETPGQAQGSTQSRTEVARWATPSGAAAGDGPLRAQGRRGAGHDRPPGATQRGRRSDGGGAARGLPALRGRRRGARAGADGRRRAGLLRRRRPEGDRDVRRSADGAGGPDGLHAADAVEADDRRDLRLLPGGRPGAGAVVRSADRDRGLDARLSRAPLGRAADRRRHPAAAADRRAGTRARPDPHRADDRRRGGAGDRPADRGRPARRAPRARARARRGTRALPAGDDARRPPRRDRGAGDDARRGSRAGGQGGAGGVRGGPARGAALRGRRGPRRRRRRR